MELTNLGKGLHELIDFLKMSFNGGTDASPAVAKAIEKMQTDDYEKADLLLLTDGDFGRLSSNQRAKVEQLQTKGNRFSSLIIGNHYQRQALEFCDHVMQYDPNYDNMIKLVKELNVQYQNSY